MDLALTPLVLVELVDHVTEGHMTPTHRRELAIAVGEDLGVARTLWKPTFDVVLRSVLEADDCDTDPFRPTLLSGRFQRHKRYRKVRAKTRVIGWFRDQEMNTGDPAERREKGKRWRLPVPADSTALVPLAGHIYPEDVRLVTTRPDGVEVKWYTVRNVSIGEVIYRIDSGPVYEGEHAEIRVTLYQRVGRDAWVRVQFDGGYDAVNLPTILAELAGEGNRFVSVTRVPGSEVPLLRPPPDAPAKAGAQTKAR